MFGLLRYNLLEYHIRNGILNDLIRFAVRIDPFFDVISRQNDRHSVMDESDLFARFSCKDREYWDLNTRYKHKATLGRIVELLHQFHDFPADFIIPKLEAGSFEKKLHAMYLSYLPKEATIFDYKMNCDDRGSFTELVRTPDRGQVSINISKPGITKGQHWHDCKNEIFIVVKGHGLIQMRNLKNNEVEEYEVSGDHIQGVWMKPGWTHNIINLSDTEDLVTVMWASEMLDKNRPDTFFEKV